MKTKTKFLAIQYYKSVIELSGFVTVFVVFTSGIGRYRVLIVYGIYSLLKALFTFINIGKGIDLILLPAIVIAIYFDLINGPIFPILSKNYFIIALLALIVIDVLVRNLVQRFLGKISEGELFVACPICCFDNKKLVRICGNCNYDIHNKNEIFLPMISQHYKGDKLKPEVLSLLNANDCDEIVYHKKLTRNIVFIKNNARELRKHFIITTSSLIFIDYQGFYFNVPKSYRNKDIVLIDKLDAVECEMKNIYMAKRPFLYIRTIDGDSYGIAFSGIGNFKDEILGIVNLITNANPQVKTKLNI